jgi:hypothetical protein
VTGQAAVTGSAGVPNDEEMAAIVAAVEMAWPRPVVVQEDTDDNRPVWRFSGRWWLPRKPVAAARRRP